MRPSSEADEGKVTINGFTYDLEQIEKEALAEKAYTRPSESKSGQASQDSEEKSPIVMQVKNDNDEARLALIIGTIMTALLIVMVASLIVYLVIK